MTLIFKIGLVGFNASYGKFDVNSYRASLRVGLFAIALIIGSSTGVKALIK